MGCIFLLLISILLHFHLTCRRGESALSALFSLANNYPHHFYMSVQSACTGSKTWLIFQFAETFPTINIHRGNSGNTPTTPCYLFCSISLLSMKKHAAKQCWVHWMSLGCIFLTARWVLLFQDRGQLDWHLQSKKVEHDLPVFGFWTLHTLAGLPLKKSCIYSALLCIAKKHTRSWQEALLIPNSPTLSKLNFMIQCAACNTTRRAVRKEKT